MAISLAFYKLFILLKIPSALDSIFIQQALNNTLSVLRLKPELR
jgi:hypothetical protein